MSYNPLDWNEIINKTEWERLGALARHKVNIIMAGSIYFGNDAELNEIREIVKAAGFNVSSGRNSELARGVYRLLRGLTPFAPDKSGLAPVQAEPVKKVSSPVESDPF